MKIRVVEFACRAGLSMLVLAGLAIGMTGHAAASPLIRYVNAAASGANNGTTWGNAYTSLQAALASAVSGEQIWVVKGTYKPTTTTDRAQTFTLKTGVAIYGGFTGHETVLRQRNWKLNATILSGNIGDPNNPYDNTYDVVTARGGVDGTGILDGFRITGGAALCGCYPGDVGGGLFIEGSTPTLRNLIVSGNSAGEGGGLFDNFSSPVLTNVTFLANTVSLGNGGGIYNSGGSSPKLTNVTLNGNTASFGRGGGMVNDGSSAVLVNVSFINNTAQGGGGIYLTNGSSLQFTNGSFSSNSATFTNGGGLLLSGFGSSATFTGVTFSNNKATNANGGGIYLDTGTLTLTNGRFTGNSADAGGGGVYNLSTNPTFANVTFDANSASGGGGMEDYYSSPTLTNVTFTGNSASSGGGMYNYTSSPTLTNATFSANSAAVTAGAIYNDTGAAPSIRDSIFWNDGSGEMWNVSPGSTIADSDVAGGCPGGSTCSGTLLNADPKLGPLQQNGGFAPTMALGAGSAALDAGNNATCVLSDERGVSRPQGEFCDMGAYEVRALTFKSIGAYDGQVLESAKGSKVGGVINSTAATFRVGDDALNRRYRGLLSFDTSPLPDTAAIVNAKLSVRQSASPTGNPFGTQGSLVADLARPFFGGGLLLESLDWQAAPTVKTVGTFISDSTWYNAVLTGTGRSHISKVASTQFRLRFAGVDAYNGHPDYLTLYSGNTSLKTSRPFLVVYYNP